MVASNMPALGVDGIAVPVSQSEASFAQFEYCNVGIGAGFEGSDRSFIAEDLGRSGGTADDDLVSSVWISNNEIRLIERIPKATDGGVFTDPVPPANYAVLIQHREPGLVRHALRRPLAPGEVHPDVLHRRTLTAPGNGGGRFLVDWKQ